MQGRPPQVAPNQQYPGTGLGDGLGQVGGNGSLPLTWKGAGHHQHLLPVFTREVDGGTQGAKGFCRRRLRLQVGDKGPQAFRALSFSLAFLRGNVGNRRQDWQAEQLLGDFAVLDGVVEIFDEKGQAAAEHDADDQTQQEVFPLSSV